MKFKLFIGVLVVIFVFTFCTGGFYIYIFRQKINDLEQSINSLQNLANILGIEVSNSEKRAQSINYYAKLKHLEIKKNNLEKAVSKEFKSRSERLYNSQIQTKEITLLADNLGLSEITKSKPKSINVISELPSLDSVTTLVDFERMIQTYTKEVYDGINKLISEKVQKQEFINPLWLKTDTQLKEIVASMSLFEKISQILMLGFNNSEIENPIEIKPGLTPISNLIVLNQNLLNQTQLQSLTNKIQALSPEIPVFIGIDQEGGPVTRLSWDTSPGQTVWPSLTETEICNLGAQRGQLLKNAGININFSPVVDLFNQEKNSYINNRTISGDPKIVTKIAQSYVECHEKFGVLTTIKHFPGHGLTDQDSHKNLPIIKKTKSDWLLTDGYPFLEIKNSSAVMVGHLVFKSIDEKPASLSSLLIQDVLKKDLDFKGLVISDDLRMLQDITSIPALEFVLPSITAGVDLIILISSKPISETLSELEKKFSDKPLTEEESLAINRAVFKVLQTKRKIK